MGNIENRVIMITGAANGIGRLLATRAASLGAAIIACDINQEQLSNTIGVIRENGGQAIAVISDVTVLTDMQRAVQSGIETFGRLDVLVNNAGVLPLSYFSDHAKAGDAWNRCIDINLKGVLHGISAVYDSMMGQGRGQIVNISSIYGNYPTQGGAVYGATKAAINFLSEALRQETQGKIKVTTVRPTAIPNTGLPASIINEAAQTGLMGANANAMMARVEALNSGEAKPSWLNANDIEYLMLEPEKLVDQILFTIDQPWGVSISDITIRASGDVYTV